MFNINIYKCTYMYMSNLRLLANQDDSLRGFTIEKCLSFSKVEVNLIDFLSAVLICTITNNIQCFYLLKTTSSALFRYLNHSSRYEKFSNFFLRLNFAAVDLRHSY